MRPIFLVVLVVAGFYASIWLAAIAYIIRDVGLSKYLELPLFYSLFLAPGIVIALWLHKSMEHELPEVDRDG